KDLHAEAGDLDVIYVAPDSLQRKKLRESLQEYEPQARLSQRLVTLKDNVELTLDPDALRFNRANSQKLRGLYSELGFQRQLAALEVLYDAPPGPSPEVSTNLPAISVVTREADLAAITDRVRAAGRVAIVPCLLGTTALGSALVGISLSATAEASFYIPL